jgi:integrase
VGQAELALLVQQVLSAMRGGPAAAGTLPFQFPSLQHLDERVTAVIARALNVEGLSQKSIRAWRAAYRQFRTYVVETATEGAFLDGQLPVQQRVLEGWIGWFRTRGVNHTTVNSYWRALHAVFVRISRQDGVLDPTSFVETPKPGRTLPKFLTRDALEQVFRFVRNYQWRGGEFAQVRNVALIAVMALGGCRLGEVLQLDMADVNCAARTIFIKKGKGPRGGKQRVVIMPPALAGALAEYLALRARRQVGTPQVFVSVDGDLPISEITVRRLCAVITEKTKIHVAPHRLRHTCATLMRQEGISDRLSMDQLGHSRLDVLQRYSHVVAGERQQALAHFATDILGGGVQDATFDVPLNLHAPLIEGMTDGPVVEVPTDQVTPP